jgi:hypothetical protein
MACSQSSWASTIRVPMSRGVGGGLVSSRTSAAIASFASSIAPQNSNHPMVRQ